MSELPANESSELSPDDSLLTLREVCEQTGWEYEKLRSYMRDAPIKEYLKVERKRGSKGMGYPLATLPFFTKLLSDVNAGKVTPGTLAGWLKDLTQEPIVQSEQSPDRQIATSRARQMVPADSRGGEVISLLEKLLAISERRESIQDDALLTLKEAASQYGVSMKALHSISVLESGRRKVRRSSVLRYIASL